MLENLSSSLDHSFFLLDTPKDRAAAFLVSREFSLNLDVILAVCAEWPEEASEWRERSRPAKWPSSELIEDIMKSGFPFFFAKMRRALKLLRDYIGAVKDTRPRLSHDPMSGFTCLAFQ